MEILRAADRKPQLWKNGGGVTREIAAHPPGANAHDFEWRISAAEVAAAGPFSHFADVDRILMVTAGAGLRLAVEGMDETVLTPESAPLLFPGDAPAWAGLIDGPIVDLNVMVRRGRWGARLGVREAPFVVAATERTILILLAPNVLANENLATGDAVVLGPGEAAALNGDGAVVVIDLRSL